MNSFLYEDKPKYDAWLLLLLVVIVSFTVILGLIELLNASRQAPGVFEAALFVAVMLLLILPRRFQILNDKLKIVLGGPLAINISHSDIREVKSRVGIKACIFGGIRFATYANHTVEIIRNKGLNIVISPSDNE